MNKFFVFVFVAAFVAFGSNAVFAHKVNVFVFVEGDQVFVEGYFTDGKKPKRSKVTVKDSSGRVVIEGETDGDGGYVFDIPKEDDFLVTLNAGQGHQAEYLLMKSDISGVALAENRDEGEDVDGDGVSTSVATAGVDAKELEVIVQRAVSQAVRPLARSLHEAQEEASFSDLVGGVGFIVGLFGVFMYFQARKTTKTQG